MAEDAVQHVVDVHGSDHFAQGVQGSADLRGDQVLLAPLRRQGYCRGKRCVGMAEAVGSAQGGRGDGEGATVLLGIDRDGEKLEVALTPRRVDEPQPDGGYVSVWRIGIGGGLSFEPATKAPGIGQALLGGLDTVGYIISASISGIYHMIAGNISSCNMRGVITIAETSGDAAAQGVGSFISFIAVLSTAIGLLNLFPIPVLDGGHLMFHAYEAVFRKAPPAKALNVLTMIGIALVLTIMVFGLSNDIFCP